MSTDATPGTRRSRCRIFQYALFDICIRFSSCEDSPIFMIRLVDESGGIIQGGLDHVGRVGVTWAIRSCTSWRARSSSVPFLKISRMEDSWDTDFERISSRPGRPPSDSSIGIVTSSSTSLDEFPSAIVCTSTLGGANSGNTSTCALGIWAAPNTIKVPAAKITSHRKFRLLPTIHRIRRDLPTPSVSARDFELRPIHLGGSYRHDPCAARRPLREQGPASIDPLDVNLLPHERQRIDSRVHERLALGVVDDCGRRDDRLCAGLTDRRRIEAGAIRPLLCERHLLEAVPLLGAERGRLIA